MGRLETASKFTINIFFMIRTRARVIQMSRLWQVLFRILTDVVKGKLSPTKLGTATEDGIEKGWLLVFAEEETAAPNAIPAAIDVTDEADDTGVGGGELRSSDNEFA